MQTLVKLAFVQEKAVEFGTFEKRLIVLNGAEDSDRSKKSSPTEALSMDDWKQEQSLLP